MCNHLQIAVAATDTSRIVRLPFSFSFSLPFIAAGKLQVSFSPSEAVHFCQSSSGTVEWAVVLADHKETGPLGSTCGN